MKYITSSVLVLFALGLLIPNAFAENVPDWVKNTAGWWAEDAISEMEFVNAIEFLVKENIIQVNVSQTSETSQSVPDWVKNTAGWWAADAISETDFINAIAYLVKVGIISIESSKSPELIAEMWVNGHITDDEFLANVEQLIEKDIITIKSDSITKTSQLPDWLVNNAGWWAARIFTNSDFDFDPGYVKEKIYPCVEGSTSYGCFEGKHNSYGFRGSEFQKQKHDIDFRIFAVGGSTTYGAGSVVDETWPAHLQQIINEEITGKKIEVINSGVSGADTETEYSLIKNKISALEPDLIILYDGWNDFRAYMDNTIPVEKTVQNWKSVCKLGKNEGFDTIIIVQPLPTTGYRVPTEHEITNSLSVGPYLQTSQQYVDAFEELDEVCATTADFRRIFDYVQEPVFFDNGHVMSFGNKIIAENVFSIISHNFGKTYSVVQSSESSPETSVVYAVGSDLSNRNFDNLNLQNAVFDQADLSNTSFKNANIDGARFMLANLKSSNLLDRNDLSNINLAVTDLSNLSLHGKDLSGTILSGADLTNTILTEADLTGADLAYVDLSEHDLTTTNLSDSILFRTNLSGMDLRSTILTGADFRYVTLSESKLLDSQLVDNNFDFATLENIDFAGKDLSKSSFNQVDLDGSDMQNTNLYEASFVQVDFTKIKDKSLAGANLTDASFAHSNLSGINLADTIIERTNFWKADLSGQDFTVTDGITDGSSFIETNLSNSNFEGVDLSPPEYITQTFKNKAYLISGGTIETPEADSYMIKKDLFGEFTPIHIISTEVSGNDLVVNYLFFNKFASANLENANFKNAGLWFVDFYDANLTNADLSGADLRKGLLVNANLSGADLSGANLSDANLSGANLSGANLSDVVYDPYTILTCKNHPICLN